MSKFLAILISFQLISFPLSAGAVPHQEEENIVDTDASVPRLNTNTPDYVDERGDSYNTDISQVKGSTGYKFYTYQPLAFGLSIVGSPVNLAMMCSNPLVPSVAAFSIGSSIFIYAEITEAIKQHEKHIEFMEEVEVIKQQVISGEVQLESLKKRLEEEKHLKDYITRRREWMDAVQLVYKGAAIAAALEEPLGVAAATAAGSGACAGIAAALASPCGPTYPACYASHFAACMAGHATGHITAKSNFINPASTIVGMSSCGALGPYAGGCTAALTAYLTTANPQCRPFSMGGAAVLGLAGPLIAAYSMGFAAYYKTDHDYVKMLRGLMTFMIPAVQSTLWLLINYPLTFRAVSFAAMERLIDAINEGLGKREEMLGRNIVKLQLVLDEFIKNAEVTTEVATGPSNGEKECTEGPCINKEDFIPLGHKPGEKASDIKGKELKKLYCFSGENKKIDFSEGSCTKPLKFAKTPINTRKLEFKDVKFAKSTILPTVNLTNKINSISADIANFMASGDEAGAKAASLELKKMSGEINSAFNKMKKSYDAKLKVAGKPFKTFDQEVDSKFNEFKAIFDKAAKDSQSGLLAGNETLNDPALLASAAPAMATTSPTEDLSGASQNSLLLINDSTLASTDDSSDLSSSQVLGDMNNEETSVILRNYNREKSKYARGEEDGLFKILSKAYVRNLEKVLTKKKEIGD